LNQADFQQGVSKMLEHAENQGEKVMRRKPYSLTKNRLKLVRQEGGIFKLRY
jgi:hypothetical protein